MNIIHKYFPSLDERRYGQLASLEALYKEWNEKINVISRKDIDNLYEHHVLHSMSIAKALKFKAGTRILDFGTGGGFPGIPLAIIFPECSFKLIDGTGKKINVVKAVAEAIGLDNVETEHIRGEQEQGKYDFVVSRAVMPLPELVKIIRKNISKEHRNALPNGVICLKGGQTDNEIQPFRKIAEVMPLNQWFKEEWYHEKQLIYVPL